MAERRPLVLVNERVRDLADGDTLGPVNPAKAFTYTDGLITEIHIYSDVGMTVLVEHRVLTYVDGLVTMIEYYDSFSALFKTRTITYTDGLVTSVVDS